VLFSYAVSWYEWQDVWLNEQVNGYRGLVEMVLKGETEILWEKPCQQFHFVHHQSNCRGIESRPPQRLTSLFTSWPLFKFCSCSFCPLLTLHFCASRSLAQNHSSHLDTRLSLASWASLQESGLAPGVVRWTVTGWPEFN